MEELHLLTKKYSLYKIANEIGASYSTVWRWINRGNKISPAYYRAVKELYKKSIKNT